MRIKIYNLDRSIIPVTQQLLGSSQTKSRKLNPVHHVFKQNAIIKVTNKDQYCLFYALQAVFVKAIGGLGRQQLQNYYRWPTNWRNDTLQLMHSAKIPFNLAEYDAVIYARRIIDYWNALYRNQYRFKVFIFGTVGHYTPKYKYGYDDYTHPLLLIHDAGKKHFDGGLNF